MKILIRISIIYQYATSADSTNAPSAAATVLSAHTLYSHTVLLVVTTPTHEHAQAPLRRGCSLHAELLKVSRASTAAHMHRFPHVWDSPFWLYSGI